jgi:hypothetical protein
MRRKRCVGVLVSLALLVSGSCEDRHQTRAPVAPPPPDFKPTRIEYADTDAFDAVLESALVNQDPAIVIQTSNSKPDWGGRLNTWIAAWNRGGRVETGATIRMQAPFLPRVDGDTIREFRLLVESLMNRVEEGVKEGSAWWAEEKIRERRVQLLRPYNLRFHLGGDGFIQVILFNGRYAQYHRRFVNSIADEDPGDDWERCYTCSRCKHAARQEARSDGEPQSRSVPPEPER